MNPKQFPLAGFSRKHQNGLALLTIMSFLLVLTVVGITTMKTSRLEQMMSGNTQWSNIAFQAAETALVASYDNNDWVAEIDPATIPSGYDPVNNTYNYSRYFVDFTSNAKRQSSKAWSAKSTRSANFKTSASGTAKEPGSGATLATARLEEGMYLVVPKL